MDLRRLKTASALVCDTKHHIRTLTLSHLREMGFGKVMDCAALDEFQAALQLQAYDLLICEAEGSDSRAFAIIRKLRFQQFDANPFAGVIVTTWKPTGTLVKRTLDCGADDLITNPFSAATLIARVEALVLRRRGFIATADYVGPDRRRDPARISPESLVDVPNTLKAKVLGEDGSPASKEGIANALRRLKEKRIKRNATRIRNTVGNILASFEVERSAPERRVLDFESLEHIIGDLAKAVDGTSLTYLVELCQALTKLAKNISGTDWKDVADRDLKLLKENARAIDIAANYDHDVAAANDISEEIDSAS